MPSVSEGFSISALEALASGTPAILANIAGLAELSADTTCTILTPTTPESIAEALLRMASIEASERRQKALTDSQLIRDRFSIQNGVESIVYGLYCGDAPMPRIREGC